MLTYASSPRCVRMHKPTDLPPCFGHLGLQSADSTQVGDRMAKERQVSIQTGAAHQVEWTGIELDL